MTDADDERFMMLALAAAAGNPAAPFGAVIVDADGTLVAEGCNRAGENPTLHGEIDAINAAARGAPPTPWRGWTLYTTAEPCPMCMGAIVWAGFGRLVFGTSVATLKRYGWRQIDLTAAEVAARAPGFPPVEITGAVLEAECDRLFAHGPPAAG